MSIVTTFENQCRALTSTSSPDEDASRFLVGTLSPNGNNLLYLFEYKDDNNNLAKVSFKFPFGEVWHLSTSPKYPSLVAGVLGNRNKFNVGIFKLPDHIANTSIEDDYGLSETPIEQVVKFDHGQDEKLVRQTRWHPDSGYQLLTCTGGVLNFLDIEHQKKVRTFSLIPTTNDFGKLNSVELAYPADLCDPKPVATTKPPLVTDLQWSSLFDCSVVAASVGPEIYGIDTRIPESSPASTCWLIRDQRCVRIRSVDFNPNSQYYIASGGDDCRANFWDLRQTSRPVLHFQTHTHWIWSIRYNPFHDRLVLTAGSDARVTLMRVQSVSSDQGAHLGDHDDYDEDDDDISDGPDPSDHQVDSDGVEKTKTRIALSDNSTHHDGQSVRQQIKSEGNKDKERNDSDHIPDKDEIQDGVVSVYREHDDAVYSVEWATDPWIFASLGLESRLVISRVPKEEKFNILF